MGDSVFVDFMCLRRSTWATRHSNPYPIDRPIQKNTKGNAQCVFGNEAILRESCRTGVSCLVSMYTINNVLGGWISWRATEHSPELGPVIYLGQVSLFSNRRALVDVDFKSTKNHHLQAARWWVCRSRKYEKCDDDKERKRNMGTKSCLHSWRLCKIFRLISPDVLAIWSHLVIIGNYLLR